MGTELAVDFPEVLEFAQSTPVVGVVVVVVLVVEVHVLCHLNLSSVEVLVLGQNSTVQRDIVSVEVDCPSDDVAGLAAPVE